MLNIGYLERLPPGKKKSTIWNSWKRQYFVAKGGVLTSYTDSSRGVLMERIEVAGGGRVDFMESTMLGVQDRRGHYVVIKCGDAEEAAAWEKAGFVFGHIGSGTDIELGKTQTNLLQFTTKTHPFLEKNIMC